MPAAAAAAAAVSLALLAGCATGALRQVDVRALGPYRDTRAVAVHASGAGAENVHAALAAAAGDGLARTAGLQPAAGADGAFRLEMRVVDATEPVASQNVVDRAMAGARSYLGLASYGGGQSGRLAIDGTLFPPGAAEPVGGFRWDAQGAPLDLAGRAGDEAGRALGARIANRRRDFADRRAADERLILTPTPLTLQPGEVVLSDDEVLLLRLGVGLGRRLQLDLLTGGLPIPAAGAGALAGPGILAAGGAGVAVLGFVDVGLKARILEETAVLPGLSLSYDMLDLFGGAVGTAGVVVFGNGAGGAGFGFVGGANAQFNLFTLSVGKHFFNRLHVTAGGWLLDNHHFLPQSVGFQAGCVAGASDGSSAAAGATACASGGAQLPRLPVQTQLFAGAEVVLGPHSAVMAEFLPMDPVRDSLGTTGIRWLIGGSRAHGLLALDRVRLRLDLAAVWFYREPRDTPGQTRRSGGTAALPWLGLGVYFL